MKSKIVSNPAFPFDFLITSSETQEILILTETLYEQHVKDGKLELAEVLCHYRPKAWKAHTIWNLFSFMVQQTFYSQDSSSNRAAVSILEEMMDEISWFFEKSIDHGSELESIFLEHFCSLDNEKSSINRPKELAEKLANIWDYLVFRINSLFLSECGSCSVPASGGSGLG